MVGVTGSIPVAPTTKCPGKSAVLANFSEDDRASQCLNKPRTLPKILTELGNAWAIRSCKVHWRRLSECALRGTLKLQSERWWMRRADALRLENPSASSLSDQHPASLPKVAARGLVSTSMRSRQEPGKMYRGFESHSLRHRPKIYRFSGVTCPAVWALCAAVFGAGLWTFRRALRVLLFSDRPVFSEALYDCDLVQSFAGPNLRVFA
jgi:hypothetical protein